MRPLGILVFGFCALSGAPTVWGQPTITEYPLPTTASNPTAIAKGPDGNLWIVEAAANKIVKVTISGVVTEYPIPTPGSLPAGITAGPDGNLWFTEAVGNKIGKITPDGTITEYPLPTPALFPASIAAGPDGNIWFIDLMGIGKITTGGALTAYSSPQLLPNDEITAGPDGNVWFTEILSDKVGRITPSGAITQFPLLAAEPAGARLSPFAITQGPDGNLWVAGDGTVWRITPAGTAVPYYPVRQPASITAGPDGNLWSTEPYNSKIVKLTTSGTFTEYPAPTGVGAFIAAGPDGNLWFTEPAADKVGKLVLSTVPPDNLLTLSQTSLTFSAAVNGSPPASQTLTVTSPTAASFTASAGPLFSPPWLTISPSGNLTGNQTITVSVNQAYIGTYGVPLFGYVLLTSGNVTQTVLVTLTLTAQVPAGDVRVLPTSLSFDSLASKLAI